MLIRKSIQRVLHQQPPRGRDPQQEQSGSTGSQNNQPAADKPVAEGREQQMGEGSYEGARQYQERTQEYLKNADVEADAQAAKPRSEQEARDLEKAEEEGRSHSKGER